MTTSTGMTRRLVHRTSVISGGRAGRSLGDRGFTIVELLVVMALIGLLAAIAVPVFSKLRSNAFDSAAQSDMRQAANQLESVYTLNGAYPAAVASPYVMTPATMTALGLKLTNSSNEIVQYRVGAALGYAMSIYDNRSNTVYCWLSAGGTMTNTRTANTAAAATAALACTNTPA